MSAAPFAIKRGQQGILFGYTITAALPGLRVPNTFYGDDRVAASIAGLLNDAYAAGAAAHRDTLALECIQSVAIGFIDDAGKCNECRAAIGHEENHEADCLTMRARADRAATKPLTAALEAARTREHQLVDALRIAEQFMAGFEGDDMQEGIDDALRAIRAVLPASEGGAA